MSAPRLILASASISRRRLLSAAGLTVEVVAANVDEAAVKEAAREEGASASETAFLLAEMKARKIAQRHPQALVIGADQILVCDGEWYDKPDSVATARSQLRLLRGRTHSLETAVVCQRGPERVWYNLSRPTLSMRSFSDAFLETYLAAERDDILGSVGAYRLEARGIQLFERIEGDFFAILGLPLLPLLAYLRQARALGG
jgi:septum formation protein